MSTASSHSSPLGEDEIKLVEKIRLERPICTSNRKDIKRMERDWQRNKLEEEWNKVYR